MSIQAPPRSSDEGHHGIDLAIGGMTCASCAARVEKRLNRMPGVSAQVNYATEKAHVVVSAGVEPDALITEVERTGYTAALDSGAQAVVGRAEGLLRARMLVALLLAVPVIVLAMVPALQFPYWQWVSLALTVPVVTWAGWPFHRATALNLRHGAATMDTLVSVGTAAAFFASLAAMLFGTAGDPMMRHGFDWTLSRSAATGNVYFEVAAGITLFLLIGRYLETRSKRTAAAALTALFRLGAKDVGVLRGGREVRTPIGHLRVGDEFVVRPGEKIATDGVILSGSSAVDVSMLTGESIPADVGERDVVTGGTVNGAGRLTVRATQVGEATRLAQLARLVERAQSGKAAVQSVADRVSAVFVPVVVGIAVVVCVIWLALGFGAVEAGAAAVSVLIIACPCALGLATPTALLVGTGRAAQLGILITGPEVLEKSRRVDTVVLDKTGTVTEGRMAVAAVRVAPGEGIDEVLGRAATLEAASEHPIARAVVADAQARGLPVDHTAVPDFVARPGRGVQGTVDGVRVTVGRAPERNDLDPWLAAALQTAQREGGSVVVVSWASRVRGVLVVEDRVKSSAADAVAGLRRSGLSTALLTGDNEATASRVACQIGIETVIAGVSPEGKVDAVADLQRRGHVVAMVGDGINDAAALATADLGMAMGTGTDVALEAADITLTSGDPRAIADALRLSRRTMSTIVANLVWAFGYNVIAIPLAAFGLMNPMLAGAAMACSSLLVVANSLRLRRFTPRAA